MQSTSSRPTASNNIRKVRRHLPDVAAPLRQSSKRRASQAQARAEKKGFKHKDATLILADVFKDLNVCASESLVASSESLVESSESLVESCDADAGPAGQLPMAVQCGHGAPPDYTHLRDQMLALLTRSKRLKGLMQGGQDGPANKGNLKMLKRQHQAVRDQRKQLAAVVQKGLESLHIWKDLPAQQQDDILCAEWDPLPQNSSADAAYETCRWDSLSPRQLRWMCQTAIAKAYAAYLKQHEGSDSELSYVDEAKA